MKIEINMVTTDAVESAKLYQSIFGFEIISLSDEKAELSEAKLHANNFIIQILNENKDYGLIAPTDSSVQSMWLNVIVSEIEDVVKRAKNNGSIIISDITTFKEAGMKNAVIKDKYNHVWVINQRLKV